MFDFNSFQRWFTLIDKHAPFRFQLYVNAAGRQVIGFHIIFDPRAIYRAGVLEQITRAFASRGIPIIHYAVSHDLEGSSHGVVFVDLTDSDIEAEDLLMVLKNMPYVLDVKLLNPIFNGFVYDQYFFPLMIGEERGIIFLQREYEVFAKRIREELGSGFSAILYLLGHDIGVNVFQKGHRRLVGWDAEKLVKVSEALFQHLGFGIMKTIKLDMDRREAIIRIYGCFECELYKRSKKPSSHLVRGMIAGWFSQFFKSEVSVIESKCIAKGDPYCEFLVKSK